MYQRQTALGTKRYIGHLALDTKRYIGQVALFPSGMLILVCIKHAVRGLRKVRGGNVQSAKW